MSFYRRRLPHVRVDGSVYFVTWRVRKGQGELSDSERDITAAAIRHFDYARYELHGFVVMNDHVHVLVQPCPGFRLQDIVQSWKSFTANRMQRVSGRRGVVWQDEYFDRVVRDDAEYEQKRDYIMYNPYKRWPEMESYPWAWAIGLD
jgi:REP element-mobilizing transposase RayT